MPDKLRLFAVLTDIQSMIVSLHGLEKFELLSRPYAGTYARFGSPTYIFSIRRSMFRMTDGSCVRTLPVVVRICDAIPAFNIP